MNKITLSFLCIPLLASCVSLAPDYVQPTVAYKDTWSPHEPAPLKTVDSTPTQAPIILSEDSYASFIDVSWWSILEDPILTGLINTSIENNPDIKIAASTIEQAKAMYGVDRANRLPQLGLSASLNSSKTNVSSLLGSASYEFDFWGKYMNASKAALSRLLASESSYRSVYLTLITDIASTYFLIKDLENQVNVLTQALAYRQDFLQLIQIRYDNGSASSLTLRQTEQEVFVAEDQLLSARTVLETTKNYLSLLTGNANFDTFTGATAIEDQLIDVIIPVGLPSSIIQRRPDVMASELNLQAAIAEIGVAKADFFPNIGLTGSGGFASNDLSNLLKSDIAFGQLDINLPLFQGGRITAQYKLAKAKAEEATQIYRKSVLRALTEVEDSLISVQNSTQRKTLQRTYVKSAQHYRDLSRLLFDQGNISMIEVIDAERNLLQAELALSNAEREYLQNIIMLYKALGGSWGQGYDVSSLADPVTTFSQQNQKQK